MSILWGSKEGIFNNLQRTKVFSQHLNPKDLVMDAIVVKRFFLTEIYATFAEDEYNSGTKYIKFTFWDRKQIDETLILSAEFKGSNWVNSIYLCDQGHRFFVFDRPKFKLKDHIERKTIWREDEL